MNVGLLKKNRGTVCWSVFAAFLSMGILVMGFRHLDLNRLPEVLRRADTVWIIALAISIPLEQVLRGWKWRQILYDIHPVATFRLFGAVMAGYFANMIVPVGVSPLVRAWLVARVEGMRMTTVLVTTAIERFVDGIVFAVLVGILITFAALPAIEGNLRLGMITAGGGSLLLFAGLFTALFVLKTKLTDSEFFLGRAIGWLEKAFGSRFAGLGQGMVEGITWPKSRLRGVGVVLASVGMKLISTTHFLWAGLAFGIVLSPFDYLFIMVFSGFALIITRFVRMPGGGVIGSAFALKILGIANEEALTMVLVVHAFSLILTAVFGAASLWKNGLTVLNLRQDLAKQGA